MYSNSNMFLHDCQSWNKFEIPTKIYSMNKNVKKRFGKNLKKFRRLKGLSQEELSFDLDLDGSYIGKVENAKLNITIDKIISIADYLGIDVIELFK